MRSVTILTGITILVLSAATAGAETTPGQSPPDPAISSAQGQDAPAPNTPSNKMSGARDKSAAKTDQSGYNSKATVSGAASDSKARKNRRPGYYQTPASDSANTIPFGPPR